jgi:hypothetical protein
MRPLSLQLKLYKDQNGMSSSKSSKPDPPDTGLADDTAGADRVAGADDEA